MTSTAAKSRFELNGWHVLAGVVGFFAVIIAVDVVFVIQAVRTYPGEVSVTPYEDGLAYNKRIAQLEAQEQLGWTAGVAAEPGAVLVKLRDEQGRPLTGLTVTGKLKRPATEVGAKALTFAEAAPGDYTASAAEAGAWDVTVEARGSGGVRFEAQRRLSWP
ncbi:MAG: FixH family protein [Phenylobacterium sp.]|jgi:nitrogen fixation protein FixH|uniref:FixH family protein n=1 Tax=Phenylobacterium sp. TaxID=1871053 RepID=UPI002A3623A2|nr:FixH family protein [Phenylobacterium sp.]MDX9999139.1 FixH family protein [Phenylobacterium sp.]